MYSFKCFFLFATQSTLFHLQNLCEALFDSYKTFKDKVNQIEAKDLRLQPCGRDKRGVMYWWQMDDCANLRIYKDDQDDETWSLVAR